MPYHLITLAAKYRIKDLLGLGWHPAAIARELGRARSTITRELHRNRTAWSRYESYPAECQARTRRCEARRHPRLAAETPPTPGGLEPRADRRVVPADR